jgi:hypothetical protein
MKKHKLDNATMTLLESKLDSEYDRAESIIKAKIGNFERIYKVFDENSMDAFINIIESELKAKDV